MTKKARQLIGKFRGMGDEDVAAHASRFFKTGPGEYGEGDQFLGIRVPVLRREVKNHHSLDLESVEALLQSELHEVRLFAALLLVAQYHRVDERARGRIYRSYLAHTRFINNWDIVDASAYKIVGPHLEHRSRHPLTRLASSSSLWERRIAIMTTLHFIRLRDFDDTLMLAQMLLDDSEDLIHKAVGWMLREVGNRDVTVLQGFLGKYYAVMPRTMLRYAIEKLPTVQRTAYLKGTV